ncbi:MAG: hypothetical protein L6R36_008581, partial [Xanthoria steineri]
MSPANFSYTVVICHGSYHVPEHYRPFLAALEVEGIEAICPQLPSSDLSKLNIGDVSKPDYDREPPPGGYPQPIDDVKAVQEVLNHLIVDSGKNVLLVGHSSGAFTATMAAVPKLQARARKENGAPGGIMGIFYECGFLIPVGESVHSFFQPKDGSEPIKHGFNGLGSTKEGAKYFFNGLEESTAKRYEGLLTASAPLTTVLDNDAYTALPLAYLVTEGDMVLPSAYQESMVAMQSQRPGVDLQLHRCPAGHSPHLTWVEGLVLLVQAFAGKVLDAQV